LVFLHEDTLGSTIATTSLWGDRLDEYDYTDYGVPIHAPVALDGRWITDIVDHSTHPDVSVVTLAGDVLEPNELLGCELRVVDSAPADAEHVFVSGTVISHLGTTLHIRDVGNDVADAWTAGNADSHALSAIYELREGFVQGTMDSAATGTFTGHGWLNEPCTLISVDHGPFDDTWMYTQAGFTGLTITLGDDSGGYVPAMVLGALDTVIGSGMKKLAVCLPTGGAVPASHVGAGKRYLIDGNLRVHEVARSGEWGAHATATAGTTFTVDPHAALTENMVGWILQPDINRQVFVPITGVSPGYHTVTVAGNYAGSATPPLIGAKGTRFRIHAPPGTVTRGKCAGVLTDADAQRMWVSATSSRCLYAGYRYEAPLSGTTELVAYTLQTTLRQGGKNFAGQHYTLNRHYDPNLMRFTSPDPAATPFFNLGAYCGNNPGRHFDPDGLDYLTNKFAEYLTDRYREDPNDGIANYFLELEPVIEGAAWKIAKMTPMGMATFDEDDEAVMQEKHRRAGTDDLFNRGGAVGGTTYVLAATIATGGYAAGWAGGMAGSVGASSGFVAFTELTFGSMAASATYQGMTTGHVRGDVMAADTLAGIATGGVLSAGARGLGALRNAVPRTTVYRVEGLPNTRITIGNRGQVSVQGDDMLFLNFGNRARAHEFFARRLGQGMPGVQLKSFQVPRSFVKELRSSAVPESMAKQFPRRPVLVDPTKAPDQFGLRKAQIEALRRAIIPRTGKVRQ
jgi:RHS repeat-associated protein